MNYLSIPNIPQKSVKYAIVDGRISDEIECSLLKRGVKLIKTPRYPHLYEAISFHPDILIHHISKDCIVHVPGLDKDFLYELSELGFKLIEGHTILKGKYPLNIAYNVARVGNFAFHNFKYTDAILKRELEKAGVDLVDVKQGYAKCSVSVIDAGSIITADTGIAKAAESKGIEALLISPEKDIVLPGLDYGFLGGSTGLIGKDVWAVTGDLDKLESASDICSFLSSKNVQPVSLSAGHTVDIGSIIPVLEE